MSFYKTILDESPKGVLVFQVLDTANPDGLRLVYANEAADKALEIPATSQIGKEIREALPSMTECGLACALLNAFWAKEPHLIPETQCMGSPDSWFRVNIIPVKNYITVWVDNITKSRDSRLTLEGAISEKAQELDSFVYAASHDLREPLIKIQAFGNRLHTKYGEHLSGKGMEYLDIMVSASNRMLALIDDLLAYSRAGRVGTPREHVPLAVAVGEATANLSEKIRSTSANIMVVNPLPAVIGDKVALGTLFQNLISNSLKFHKPGMNPSVTIRHEATEGGLVIITVEDTGIGFDPKYEERVFNLFERLHTRFEYPGTGVGLALCKRVVERHHGWIHAEGRPGLGALFRIALPVA